MFECFCFKQMYLIKMAMWHWAKIFNAQKKGCFIRNPLLTWVLGYKKQWLFRFEHKKSGKGLV